MENKRIPQLCSHLDCTGCASCANACPKDAIHMIEMSDGFLQPVVNKDKCIGCLLCEKSCPVINSHRPANRLQPTVYACWNKNRDVRLESSSGGAFSALATSVLRKGGYVAGAAFNHEMRVSHILIHSAEDLHKLRGSKYVQSDIGDIYRQVKTKLGDNAPVLFVGTPCQAAGLKHFLRKDYPNLFCCDFICHGTPSPLLFQKYIKWVEQEKGMNIFSFNFRHKHSGWYDALRVANDWCVMKGKYDAYFFGFNRDLTLRESCYHCPALGLPRASDITIADFWGIGMQYKFERTGEIHQGVSLVMTNNEKGDELFEQAKPYLHWQRGMFDEAIARNQPLIKPSHRPSARNTFYADMESIEFEHLRLKYFQMPVKARLVAWFRENAPRSCVVGLRKIVQYITWKRNGSKTI